MYTIKDCKVTPLPQEEDPRGSLTYLYSCKHVPFDIRRVFYIYDVPAGKDRGTHAHKECWEFIIAASGALEVYLFDGHEEKVVGLNRPYEGLVVPPGIWAQERGFASGTLCLVLASHDYDEADYMREMPQFMEWRQKGEANG